MAEEQDQEENDPLQNPDEPCNNCGSTNWQKLTERKPTDHPEASDITKHYFVCEECDKEGYIFETGGILQYTGNLRK